MDKEKVIKAYEDFVNGYECFCTSDDYEYEIHKAVLALLKEQEEKTSVECEHNGYWYYTCPTCGNHEELFREWNYCPFCGQAVKWE